MWIRATFVVDCGPLWITEHSLTAVTAPENRMIMKAIFLILTTQMIHVCDWQQICTEDLV
jgi:hypothetical protein